jgi:hypothetical protein
MSKAIVISPKNVSIEEVDGFQGAKEQLDGAYLELLNIREDACAFVDEEGKLKGLPINVLATLWFRLLKVGLQPDDFIVGTVVVFGQKMSDNPEEGLVECDVPEDIIEHLEDVLVHWN